MIEDELKRMEARRDPDGAIEVNRAECGEPIPEAHRSAIPRVKFCIDYRKN